ncbi:MAG: aminoacetone oxidase family FAD-binding enzyme [Slackia sp.]|nr:aminoacetone oxidase family FAD-binding enzyme [Slackia sp.]
MTRVAIVGGGAAGLVAAIEAARCGAEVVVFEAADRVGKKILATGNGRCNISNADIMSDDYNRSEFVQAAMNALPPEEVQRFFSDAGLLAFEEDEGRVYPYSNKAATVVDVLRLCLDEAEVEQRCSVSVRSVRACKGADVCGWEVEFADGGRDTFDAVVVAVGGAPEKGLVPDDVKYVAARPVLAALKTDTANIKGLSGIRVRARLYLDADPADLRDAWMDVVDPDFESDYMGPETSGEILFRDYGISGIAAFDMSRYVRPGQMVFIDLLPDLDPQQKVDFIWNQTLAHPRRTAAQIMSGMLPSRVARAVTIAAGIDPDEPIVAEQEAVVLAMVSESFGLTVKGIADPKQAQVMRGGYAVKDFDAETMECKKHPGLFAAGEALDVDGRCGGYNLHWAWTSGMLAGRAAARLAGTVS